MMLRVWWKEMTDAWTPKPTGKTLTGIVVGYDGYHVDCLVVRRDDGKFENVDQDDEDVFIKSEWVDRP